nr:MAG TPA: hypothetical protein [Ackermannviridae sp.]
MDNFICINILFKKKNDFSCGLFIERTSYLYNLDII